MKDTKIKDIMLVVVSIAFSGIWVVLLGPFLPIAWMIVLLYKMIHPSKKAEENSEKQNNSNEQAPIIEGEIISQTEKIQPHTLEEEILRRYR